LENELSLDLFGLRGNPFGASSDGNYPYLSTPFREALAAVFYELEYGSRVLMVSAHRGCGKTTLLQHLERCWQGRRPTLLVPADRVNDREILRKIVADIGGIEASDNDLRVREQVDQALGQVATVESPFILLLDCGEDGGESAVQTLSCFVSLEAFKKGLLKIVITASPEIAKRQGLDHSEEIRHAALSSLTPGEVEEYIAHRLQIGGWRRGRLFTKQACAMIAERSSANPSAINKICFGLLQALAKTNAHGDGKNQDKELAVDEAHIDLVTSDPSQTNVAPSHWLARRRAAWASAGLVLAIGMAGFWYRGAINTSFLKRDSLEMTKKVDALLSFAGFLYHRDWRPRSVDRDTAANDGDASAVATTVAQPAASGSGLQPDRGTAQLPRAGGATASVE
jgi:general secretion pathway protein A